MALCVDGGVLSSAVVPPVLFAWVPWGLLVHWVAAMIVMMTLVLLPLSTRFLRVLAVLNNSMLAAGAAAADPVLVGHRNGAAVMSVVMRCSGTWVVG